MVMSGMFMQRRGLRALAFGMLGLGMGEIAARTTNAIKRYLVRVCIMCFQRFSTGVIVTGRLCFALASK